MVREVTLSVSEAVTIWLERIAQAALTFEARWTMLTLRRVDTDLADRLADQRNLWVEAVIRGSRVEVERQGAAMVRGYVVAAAALEAADVPDEAYQIGRDPHTGTVVAIGAQKAAIERARKTHGEKLIHITPDEIAVLFGKIEALRTIGEVRRRFPGAEIVENNNGSKNDVTAEIDGDETAFGEDQSTDDTTDTATTV